MLLMTCSKAYWWGIALGSIVGRKLKFIKRIFGNWLVGHSVFIFCNLSFFIFMSQVLYRKYRPKDFDEIIGRDDIKLVLTEQLKRGTIAHAYLFAGPRGTGKTTIARLFARKVNDLNGEDLQKEYLDIIEIDAASNRGIEEVKELRQKVNFAPASLKYKVYIIDEVHMLTKEAFNALLKTLEEPPSHVIFILATTEAEKLPITVISRTLRFNFKLASLEELEQRVKFILQSEGKSIEDSAIKILTHLGKGSFRDTETILEKVLSSSKIGETMISKFEVEQILGIANSDLIENFVTMLISLNKKKVFELINQIESSGINSKYFLEQVLEEMRKILIRKVIKGTGVIPLKNIAFIISNLLEAYAQLRYSPIEFLPLQLAVINIFESEKIKPTEQIEESVELESKIPKKNSKKESKESKEILNDKINDVFIDIERIRDKWKEVVMRIKPFNHHLVAFLAKSKPVSLRGRKLELLVAYKFHKQRIEQKKSSDAITKVIKEVYGIPLDIYCRIDESMKVKELSDDLNTDSNEELVEEIFGEKEE